MVDLQAGDVIVVWLTVLFIGFLAALYPVRVISKRYLKELETGLVN